MSSNDTIKTIRIVVDGQEKVGKTFFIKKLFGKIRIDEKMGEKYCPTIGIEDHSTLLDTNRGLIRIAVWDWAGSSTFVDRISYYSQADAGILFGRPDDQTEIGLSILSQMTKHIRSHKIDAYVVHKNKESEYYHGWNFEICLNKREEIINVLETILKRVFNDNTLRIESQNSIQSE
jgi:GTPase SAR1 family protein